jgi:hypothetical protein
MHSGCGVERYSGSEAVRGQIPVEGVEEFVGLDGPWKGTQGILI